MNDVLNDIEVIENAIIAFTEGASDEKRMALLRFKNLLMKRKTS